MSKKTNKPKTKAPTGLTIARQGDSYVFSWKIGDANYGDGQSLEWRVNDGPWNAVKIGKAVTSKAVTIKKSDYNPTGKTIMSSVSFRVKGNRSTYTKGSGKKKKTYRPTVSDWATKTEKILVPDVSNVVAELSDTMDNVTTFTWTCPDPSEGAKIFARVEYQTMLIHDCNVKDGAKLAWASTQRGWATGTSAAAYSYEVTEDTSLIQQNVLAWTRWVRIRAVGPAGASAWRYASHIYCTPYQAEILDASAKAMGNNVLSVAVKWRAQATTARPIDTTTVQYAIPTPDAGMMCPAGASWTDVAVSRDTSGTDYAGWQIGDAIPQDKAVFVRVNTQHDRNVKYGNPKMVYAGALPAPSNLSVTADQTTHRATITATNNSTIADSFLVVHFEYVESASKGSVTFPIAVIPKGSTQVTVQCPNWSSFVSFSFVVQAMVGQWRQANAPNHSAVIVWNTAMRSDVIRQGGVVPKAPTISLAQTDIPGTVMVNIGWEWDAANACEISWAEHPDAWESTDQPQTYRIENQAPPAWRISGLSMGMTWYIRCRLIMISGDDETLGEYSETKSINLASAPLKPTLALSAGTIIADSSLKAVWSYATTDGTEQALAEVAEAVDGANPRLITTVSSGQSAVITARQAQWAVGTTHRIIVRVTSGSGLRSEWSDPVAVSVAMPLVAAITQTSLVAETVTVDGVARHVNSLKEFPLSIIATGAGAGGLTTVIIERAETYHVDRPDETDYNGFEGETVCIMSHLGEGSFTIEQDDLIGILDDGAKYRIIATVQDGLGQSDEASLDFEVHWTHQALMPLASIRSDRTALVTFITPIAPAGAAAGDTCDIYRLSVDKPELIYRGAQFGTTYVDPFPTIGEYGGHRIVFRTANGDYVTAENELAWIDTDEFDGDLIETGANVINFGAGRVELEYNVDISNSWKKDFEETAYLGGSIQGDWNPAVSRTGTVSGVAVSTSEQDTIRAMRRLATHAGICHVRTKDGSSYPADVQVSESYKVNEGHKMAAFNLKITRVDQEDQDGMTYAEWAETQGGTA